MMRSARGQFFNRLHEHIVVSSGTSRWRWALALATSFTFAFPTFGAAILTNLPNYQIGQTARVDIVTPIKLIVIDPVATEKFKREHATKAGLIFRYDPAAADEVAEGLQLSFAISREKFLAKMQAAFNARELSDAEIASPRFRTLMTVFQWENKLLPLDSNLAQLWAQGGSDKELIDQFTVKLRGVMGRYIREGDLPELPPETKNTQPTTRIFTIDRGAPPPGLETVEQQNHFIRRTEIVSLERAKKDFRNTWPEPERTLPRIVEKQLKPNCVYEEELTRQALAKKINSLYSANQYEPGQTIVRRGDIINAKTKAALEQLRTQSAVQQLQTIAGHENGVPRFWWWCGAAAIIFAAGFVLWRLNRRTRSSSLLPVPLGSTAVMLPGDHEGEVQAMARSGLMRHLARLLADKLVRQLFSQRSHLLAAQHTATRQATEFEQRLAEIQTKLQDRLIADEKRIAELEKELALSEGEKRDLLRAKIVLAREEYQEDLAKSRLPLN